MEGGVSQANIRRLIIAAVGLGLAAVATVLALHNQDAAALPGFGALVCLFEVLI